METSAFMQQVRTALTHYVGVGFMILAALAVYLVLYPSQINERARITLEALMLGYLVIAPGYYFVQAKRETIGPGKPSRSLIAATFLAQLPLALARLVLRRDAKPASLFPDRPTQQAVLSVLVKFFFAPLMISFFFSNISHFVNNFSSILWGLSGGDSEIQPQLWWRYAYRTSVYALLIVDTMIFAPAYLIESRRLGNAVKSVDATFGGWAVALVCYPPFNFVAQQSLASIGGTAAIAAAGPVTGFPHIAFFIVTQIIAFILLAIYVWASVALGFRAGNLVNRGIIEHGPYRYVRHPAYIAKNLYWLLGLLPFLAHPFQIVSWSIWAGVYALRAITEERHLLHDPAYRAYAGRVPCRFIPGLI